MVTECFCVCLCVCVCVYAVLFWLRHLDPTSRITPVFYTDNQRVSDGFNGHWDVGKPWCLHRDLWAAVRVARDDVRDDVQVRWRRGHIGPAAAERLSPEDSLAAFGNAWAHTRARRAAAWHPSRTSEQAVLRTDSFALHLSVAYARFLEWALEDPERMPQATVLDRLFPLPRPPAIPLHTYACDGHGIERCIRCLLPPALAGSRPCRPHGNMGHSFMAIGGGLCCRRCGSYAFQRLELLGTTCRGRPPGGQQGTTAWRLRRMLQGRHPKTGAHIGNAAFIDPSIATFTVVLVGTATGL